MSVTGHIIGNWNLSGEVNETGEGSSVVPNPPGDPTDALTKIEIDDVVYSITGNQIQSDWTQSDTSAVDYIKNKPTLSTVATSGSYDDLTDKPTIPAAQVNSDWDAASGVAQILNKPTLSNVATSGSYDDLTDKPTIPAAQVNSDWNSNSGVSQILNKPTLGAVATSNSYNDLFNKPTIPTIEANPVGAATDTLTKVNIDGSIYDIPSGGGGSITLTKLTKVQYDALTPAQKADPTIIYFIDDPVPVLDPDYTYHKALNDQIVVRVYHEGEADQHIVWFFNGFEKTSSDISVPAELTSYVPTLSTSVTSQAMSPTSSEASYDYWIGWSSSLGTGVIRSWNSSWGSTVGGTFWSVVDNDGGDEQENEYTSPYVYITDHSDNYIYYQGIRYDDTSAENVSYDNTVSGLSATNVQSAVDELKSNLTQLPESGSNANGNYMKFPDGTMICTKTVTTSVTYSAWGSWYESSIIDLGDFAETFISTPIVTLSLNNSSTAASVGGANPTTTSAGNTRCFRPNAGTTTNSVTIGVIAIGRWKN